MYNEIKKENERFKLTKKHEALTNAIANAGMRVR